MADIHIVRKHSMPLKKAREAADGLAARLGEKFDLESEWDGDTLNFERSGVKGSLALAKTEVTIDVRLGLLLSAFKGSMEEQINEQLDQLFSSSAAAPAKKAAKKKA
jgi:putative polyhydroxyalkanoate system protein